MTLRYQHRLGLVLGRFDSLYIHIHPQEVAAAAGGMHPVVIVLLYIAGVWCGYIVQQAEQLASERTRKSREQQDLYDAASQNIEHML